MDGFYADNGRIQVIKDDDIAFDSDRPSIQLLPESSKLTISHTVTFPTLLAGIAYLQRTYGSTPYCESWSSLIPQEWGPDEVDFSPTNQQGNVATRNLPETLIGSVPAGTDYIDVRARMTRTQSPPSFMQQTPPLVMFQEGQWIGLPGGSCPCEYFVPLARHFDIELRGTSLYLRRFQSVRNSGENFNWGNNANVANSYGWFTNASPITGSSPYQGAKVNLGTPAALIQTRSGSNSVNRRAPWAWNSTGACSITHPNYASVYACEFEIIPGRYKPGT
jgi:hypothetical protein